MHKSPKKIAFVIEDFQLQSPSQQLLDRFLIGFFHDGRFHKTEDCQIALYWDTAQSSADLDRRIRDYRLQRAASLKAALDQAEAVTIVWRGHGEIPNDALLESVVETAPPGVSCFVHGPLGSSLEKARTVSRKAEAKKILLLSGTAMTTTFRLPDLDIPEGARLKESLVVVQGESPAAELDALEALFPFLEHRRNGEAGVVSVQRLLGDHLWHAEAKGDWSRELLGAALSRSNTLQGDTLKDGRTQNLVGLGLVSKLAQNPRGWLLEHRDGLRSALLVLNGVLDDCNVAFRTEEGKIYSTQLFRAPAPGQEHYSRLAQTVKQFFQTGTRPWPTARSQLIAGLMSVFSTASEHNGSMDTPELQISYRT